MIELILGTYGAACWLIFKKFKLVPITTYTVCTAVLGGMVLLVGLLILLSVCHPVSHDGRFYSTVTQIVPQVRGKVLEVPVKTNAPLKTGDVLFRIDPKPYQLEVDRLEAMLAGMNAQVSQLDARLASAQAATEVARSNLLVSESDYDRQARISLDISQTQIDQTETRLSLAKENLKRSQELAESGAASQRELDADQARVDALESELLQAKSAEQKAQETLASGSNRLKAARDELKRAEAQEREARVALEAESDGVNPDVRQAMAELERKRWELEQTVVRAPTDGYVTQVTLRPGQMATPFSPMSAMLFIPDEKQMLVARYPQNAIAGIETGLDAELAFQAYPGRIFPAKVEYVFDIIPEGQFLGMGKLQGGADASVGDDIPVKFVFGEDVEALNLPTGAHVSIAVYTHNFHALAIVRKIILRIKSWENYVFFMKNFDAVH
ncbi:Inner membrane protein YibH [Rosistilla carotiformis]|uniref:Inner membrane protein YibH n=1 Tax=Rosistilla carotiformis TaxID=2528017 RepID=A0A518JUZ0_9BACT|nr:HlyD family secretion protein [Rosistilla carotiformis]QDV69359.1 Inner membrane protein YibH [Rosistilla carotiformis]